MSAKADDRKCDQTDNVALFVLGALPGEAAALVEVHFSGCQVCRQELDRLRTLADSWIELPSDKLLPSDTVRERIARRIGNELGREIVLPAIRALHDPDWEEVAPGITCKLLATDTANRRVSMLVRLAAGVEYPPHVHGGVEEVHLLDGELWIDDRKLHAGDFNRAEPGTSDKRVWSETGCTCVLITSTDDILRPAQT